MLALLDDRFKIYHKEFDITEFVGEALAKTRGILSAHYVPVLFCGKDKLFNIHNYFIKSENIRVGSFDFKEEDILYLKGTYLNYLKYDFYSLLLSCKNEKNKEELLSEFLEYYALDIYSSRQDRIDNVYYEFHSNGEIHVSALFDYEQSLSCNILNDGYESDFHKFKSIDDYHEFIVKYPNFEGILKSYLYVDMVKLVEDMAIQRGFDLEQIDFDSYKRYDEFAHKKLEKILK